MSQSQKLTTEEREQVRLSLLRYGRGEVSVGLARSYLAGEGFRRLTHDDVAAEIQYLVDKGLMVEREKMVSPENLRFRTTASGTDYLARQGQE